MKSSITAHLLTVCKALLYESAVMAQVLLKPPVKAHSAALLAAWQYDVGGHPWPVSVDHEVGI